MKTRAVQSMAVREDAGGARVVEGIAVPWGQTIEFWGDKERFDRGAFGEFRGGAALYANHGHLFGQLPIGRVTESEDREDGQFFRAVISQTPAGDEAYTLLRDGVLTGLSVGFDPLETRQEDDGDGPVTVYVRAAFREVSVVGFPAYSDAVVTAVRAAAATPPDDPAPPAPAPTDPPAEDDTMTPEQIAAAIETSSVVTELRQQHAEQARQLAVLQADGPGGAGGTAALPYRSLAEFIKALADRNARPSSFDARGHAELLTRAYSGATTTDAHADGPAWIKRDVRLVAENRNVLELFSKEPLPAEGMAVSYPQFGSKSGEVGEQAAQGDDLPYLELRITDDSAPVRTYGGYSELSRQAIERAGVPYLAKVLRMQAISYAKQTNGVVRTALAAGAAAYNQLTMPAAPTATEAIDAVLDGAQAVHANSLGLEAEVWLMTLAQFKSLAHITDSAGRPIFVLNGDGSNTIGNANITALRGSVAGFPFVVDLGMTGTYSYMVSSEALTVLEQPGAPFNLEDENIVNLTKQFSLYGYLALTKNDPKGVTRVTHAAQANG